MREVYADDSPTGRSRQVVKVETAFLSRQQVRVLQRLDSREEIVW